MAAKEPQIKMQCNCNMIFLLAITSYYETFEVKLAPQTYVVCGGF